jgi:glutamyl-tRNA reductase
VNDELVALTAHARSVGAEHRAAIAQEFQQHRPRGSVVLATCHRVELYSTRDALRGRLRYEPGDLDAEIAVLRGEDVVRHVVRVAVGRDSAIVAEDQILHQLRAATYDARRAGSLSADLDRVFDMALRAGRVARSWLPSRRPSLVDVALARAGVLGRLDGSSVLVVGAGEMGSAAVMATAARGARVTVASRNVESAEIVAARFQAASTSFDPRPAAIADAAGIVIALKGPWLLSAQSEDALACGEAWVVDLSSPPVIRPGTARRIGTRLTTIDDLAATVDNAPSTRLLARLDQLIETTVRDYAQWRSAEERREAASALSSRARDLQAVELEWLWRKIPTLDEDQRREVARAVDHFASRLLRDPLEQLGTDGDGSRARAARDLFRL